LVDIAPIRDYFTGLQDRIIGELEGMEGQPFLRDAWDRPQGGGGISRLIEDGRLFERGGVNFSHVKGEQMPASATAHRPELAGRPLGGDGCFARHAPAQSVLPHGAHECSILCRRKSPGKRRSGGSAAAWT
jgi:coproporphyrinogen III oxidase